MHTLLEEALEAACKSICGSDAAFAQAEDQSDADDEGPVSPAVKRESECLDAPRKRSWRDIGMEALKRAGIQLLFFGLMMTAMWWQGVLPRHIAEKLDAVKGFLAHTVSRPVPASGSSAYDGL